MNQLLPSNITIGNILYPKNNTNLVEVKITFKIQLFHCINYYLTINTRAMDGA